MNTIYNNSQLKVKRKYTVGSLHENFKTEGDQSRTRELICNS